ncbi:BPTI/Kunitz domain-containing protein 4-like [Octopus sinensis]|uniref:BPTI/Kunitz domain-containing protein 4-like n=1 Tax=Octopus sinensis TaxID=2607531 RepID=A0A7E6EQL8_9MOLL|nr:BPTI/Kunitz domain-containing protein 4-like [Octopus sinensis]XP_036357640.1 BPTI/Kunitz domain-containing protein 4-like [Octopus sinensis]
MINKSGCLTIFIVFCYLANVGVFSFHYRSGKPLFPWCLDVSRPYCGIRCPLSGFDTDGRTGCPTCRCRNRCEEVTCNPGYTCQVKVGSKKCPSGLCKTEVAKCVPAGSLGKVENICEAGTPNGYCFGKVSPVVNCIGNYKCVIHPSNNYGLCCLKPSATTFSNVPLCEQPTKVGLCRARMLRYFFNSQSGHCEIFSYSGCQGNENNFETKEECEQSCRNYCEMRAEPGFCLAKITRYYYDRISGTCRMFHYGGCGGNGNNFYTKRDCLNYCSSRRPAYGYQTRN